MSRTIRADNDQSVLARISCTHRCQDQHTERVLLHLPACIRCLCLSIRTIPFSTHPGLVILLLYHSKPDQDHLCPVFSLHALLDKLPVLQPAGVDKSMPRNTLGRGSKRRAGDEYRERL